MRDLIRSSRILGAVTIGLAAVTVVEAQEGARGPRLPDWAYVTRNGSFDLHGGKGKAMYCRPGGLFISSNLELADSPWENGWWYKEKGSAFYLGFEVPRSGCWVPSVYLGHWDTNGHWHMTCLGDARICHHHADAHSSSNAPGVESEELPLTVSRQGTVLGQEESGRQLKGDGNHKATIVAHLPPDAKLTIDGYPTASGGKRRGFNTPPLEHGRDFFYILKASLKAGDTPYEVTRRVLVRAGATTEVHFEEAGTPAGAGSPTSMRALSVFAPFRPVANSVR